MLEKQGRMAVAEIVEAAGLLPRPKVEELQPVSGPYRTINCAVSSE